MHATPEQRILQLHAGRNKLSSNPLSHIFFVADAAGLHFFSAAASRRVAYKLSFNCFLFLCTCLLQQTVDQAATFSSQLQLPFELQLLAAETGRVTLRILKFLMEKNAGHQGAESN